MCGRFTLTASAEKLREFFPLFKIPDTTPRYNIAPTQTVLAIRQSKEKEEAPDATEPEAAELRWGLIPSWAKDKKIGASLINARSDTVATKPAFRTAFKRKSGRGAIGSISRASSRSSVVTVMWMLT